jgi:copper homeostasis protein
MIQAARPLEVTFHRAFDVCADQTRALEELIELGVERILTSGGQAAAWDGRLQIAQMVQQAGNRICVMAGAGVRPENIRELRKVTRAQEFHFSARRRVSRVAINPGSTLKMGALDEPGWQYITDGELIRRTIAAASAG